MKKLMLCLIGIMICSFNDLRPSNVILESDTIDYGDNRIYFKAPIQSIKNSTLVYDDEGFVVMYPIVGDSAQISVFTIDFSLMNSNFIIYADTDSVDYELWNTFNNEGISGSRCYIKDELYYMVERFSDGLEIYYAYVPENLLEIMNSVIQSIRITKRDNNAPAINESKRRLYHQWTHP